MGIFSPGEKIGLSQRLAYYRARLSVIRKRVLDGQDVSFDPLAAGLYVNLFPGSGHGDTLPSGTK